jgi:hypothetical protein
LTRAEWTGSARTLCGIRAGVAIGAARATGEVPAVDVGFAAIGDSIGARRCLAALQNARGASAGSTDAAGAIRAFLAGAALVATIGASAAAIDVRFRLIGNAVIA